MGKKLLTSGCSYTHRKFKDYCFRYPDFKEWPHVVSQSLELKDLNVAESGNSNQSITNSLIRNLNGNDIDTVMVLWSGWDRWEMMFQYHVVSQGFIYNYIFNKKPLIVPDWVSKTQFDEFMKTFLKYGECNVNGFIERAIDNTLNNMYTIAKLCESENIKYVFQQGVIPIDFILYKQYSSNFNQKDTINYLLNHPNFKPLEKRKDHIIGWPFFKDLNGEFIDYERCRSRIGKPTKKWPDPYDMTDSDPHPNPTGHRIIADIFLERYKEIYNG